VVTSGKTFFVKMQKSFLNTMQKILSENYLTLPRNSVKKDKMI